MSHSDNFQRLVKLSPVVREVIAFADAERQLIASPALTTGHLLLGLMHLQSPVIKALHRQRVVLDQTRQLVDTAIQYGVVEQRATGWSRELATFFDVFSTSIQEDPDVSQEVLLLLQLVKQPNCISSQILSSLGVTVESIRQWKIR